LFLIQHFTSACLSGTRLGEFIVNGFIEAYSCKPDRTEAKLYHTVRTKVERQISSSPKVFTEKMASSPLGPINHSSTIQLLVQLISTLNSSLPEHDFSNLQASDFVHCANLDLVVNEINEYLLNYSLEAKHQGSRKKFWSILDGVINLKKSQVFSFVPDDESEVFGKGKLWTMNYFFVNKSAKKIVFFACSAQRKLQPYSMFDTTDVTPIFEECDEEMFDMEMDISDNVGTRTYVDLTQRTWVS